MDHKNKTHTATTTRQIQISPNGWMDSFFFGACRLWCVASSWIVCVAMHSEKPHTKRWLWNVVFTAALSLLPASPLYILVCVVCVCVCHSDTQTKCTEFYCFQSVLFGLACIHTVIWNCSWPLRKGPSHTVQSIAPNWSWTVWLHHCGETTFTNNSNGSRPTHTHWHKMN